MALQTERPSTPASPPVSSAQEGLPEIVPLPARRRTQADATPFDGSAWDRTRPAFAAPAQRPAQRLAGDVQGQASTRPARSGDGLVRWLSE